MNKFLLIVLLLFVQSKKFNTFQEFNFRNLFLIDNKEKEELRKNEELKKIAYKFHEMFEKSNNQEEINLALEEDYEKVVLIVEGILGETNSIVQLMRKYDVKDIKCLLEEDTIKTKINEGIFSFYEDDNTSSNDLDMVFYLNIIKRLIECKNK